MSVGVGFFVLFSVGRETTSFPLVFFFFNYNFSFLITKLKN